MVIGNWSLVIPPHRAQRDACGWVLQDSNVSERSEGRLNYRASLAEVPWKRDAKEGNSPVSENGFMLLIIILKYGEERQPRRNPAALVCQG